MGAIEVLIRRFRSISSAKLSFAKKLDSIAFLLQYIPIILTFIMGISLMVLIPFIHFDILNNILFPVWIAFLALYAYVFVLVGKKLNFTYKETLISLGRISSYTIALSPFMLLWTFRAFKSERLYMVTPKRQKTQSEFHCIYNIIIWPDISIRFNNIFHRELVDYRYMATILFKWILLYILFSD
jgi:hypothetical protein